MERLNIDALLFCIAWAAMAVAAALAGGLWIGVAVLVIPFPVIIPVSALILTKTSNFVLERAVRWGLLGLAAIGLFIGLRA